MPRKKETKTTPKKTEATTTVSSNDDDNPTRVLIVRDTMLEFPQFWWSVYVEGCDYDQRAFAKMFSRACCHKADTPDEADLVVFTGGEDLNPSLYGETAHKSVRWVNNDRDAKEMELYLHCLEKGIPMFGVCRGAQFLHVMNGGKLFQDINNHHGDHNLYDSETFKIIAKISSVHHQSCVPQKGMEMVGHTYAATERWENPDKCRKGNFEDVEAFWYQDTTCFGVQGHPEYAGYFQYLKWTLDKLEFYIAHNKDLEICKESGFLRVRKEILENRMRITS